MTRKKVHMLATDANFSSNTTDQLVESMDSEPTDIENHCTFTVFSCINPIIPAFKWKDRHQNHHPLYTRKN